MAVRPTPFQLDAQQLVAEVDAFAAFLATTQTNCPSAAAGRHIRMITFDDLLQTLRAAAALLTSSKPGRPL